MIDQASTKFWTLLAALPSDIQELAHKQFKLYKGDPHHPSVNFKSLPQTTKPIWSARINNSYRALALRTTNAQGQTMMLWFWIGTHTEYDKLKARL